MAKIMVIDGNSLINRAFYATPILTNSKGQFTNAVYGFINMLIKAIGDLAPTHILVAFDMRAKTFRHDLFEDYKAGRKGMPDELAAQMPLLHDVLESMKIKILEQEGIEADDILGTVAYRFLEPTVILTGDRDALQLISDSTTLYLTKKGISDLAEVDVPALLSQYGLRPEEVVEYKALLGDSSDNIPGVKGVGEKTALMLIQKYHTVDAVYADINQIAGKLRDKLIAGRESAELSRTLATINVHCKLDVTLEDMEYQFPFTQCVREKFEELEFKSLLKREDIFMQADKPRVAESVERAEEVVGDLAKLEALCEKLFKAKQIAFDMQQDIHIAILSSQIRVSVEYVIPITETFLPDTLNLDMVLTHLKPILESENIQKVVFDGKAMKYQLKAYGLSLNGVTEDIAIKKYLVEDSVTPKSLQEAIIKEGLSEKHSAVALLELSERMGHELMEFGMEKLYYEMEMPLSELLYEMEQYGFKVDLAVIQELGDKYTSELDRLSEKIYQLAGEQFNINSTRQLSRILFEKLALASGKKTKTGLSTGIEVLESLQSEHEIVPLIMQYRKLNKLSGTYIEGLKPLIERETSLVHTIFKQTMTTTGRLSSTEPNLQNIPVREEEGREIRKMFVKRDDQHILVSADYSQIELRLMAHLSGDEKLIRNFLQGDDIHTSTAAAVFGIDKKLVTPSIRRSAKAVNFGIIYGISDFGLSAQLGISVKQAKEFIQNYLNTYSGVKTYMTRSVELAKSKGYAESLFKRRRKIPELYSANYNVRSFGERAAMNMPLQGTAADIIKLAMLNVSKRMKKEKLQSKLILQVHDELIIDACVEEVNTIRAILHEEMENCVKLSVPLEVNISMGDTWYDAK